MKQNILVVMVLALSVAVFSGYFISCGGGGGGGDGGGGSGGGPTYPAVYANGKIIFVTSTIDTGNLKGWMPACTNKSTGLEAADCICQEHAVRWGNLSGTYKAWLSDSTTSAASRLSHSTIPYVNRRGELIAANWTALTNGTMQCSDIMNYDESGEYAPTQFSLVWTGTDAAGNIRDSQKTCNNWTTGSLSFGGYAGCAISISQNFNGCWTSWGWRLCDDWNRLYCVEQ